MVRIVIYSAMVVLTSLSPVAATDLDKLPTLRQTDLTYGITKDFADESDKKPQGISGIACMQAIDARRICLVVNDESTGAQLVEITGNTMTPGSVVNLVGGGFPPETYGAPIFDHHCSGGKGDFGEFDGEGVAYADGYFYVVGSHGCSRKKDKFRLSSFFLARFKVDQRGAQVGSVETTFRLGDALKGSKPVASAYGTDLGKDEGEPTKNGLNVEGIAVIDGDLFAGLRAPSQNGQAFVVRAKVADLFAPGQKPLPISTEVIPLPVGKWAGIRDMTAYPGKRLLVLIGPAQEQDIPYALLTVEPRAGGAVKPLGRLPPAEAKGKAEAVVMNGDDRALILFDSLKNGGPREYEVPKP